MKLLLLFPTITPSLLNYLAFLIISTLPVEAANLDVVRSAAGRALRRGQEYYVRPVVRGRGGGLTLAGRNNSCPLYVAQEASEISGGLPVTFSPVNPHDKLVRLSTDLNVEFSAATICVQSTVWRLGGVDAVAARRYVVTGGVKGNPGLGTVSDWFKIERHGKRDYKLVFCPSVCKLCKVVCGDVGVLSEGGKRWLGLSNVPFPVMFETVKSKAT